MIESVEFWRRSGRGYEMNIKFTTGENFQHWIDADSLFYDALHFLEFSIFTRKYKGLFK